jgi:signal transduction histidine kinase
MAEQMSSQWNLKIKCDVVGGNRSLPLRVETGLYRIAQEALTNVRRHAAAKQVAIRLVTLPNRAELTVEDDGSGFDPMRVPEGRYGLIGLNERAKLMGGTLQVTSRPGAGTRLHVVVPLELPR